MDGGRRRDAAGKHSFPLQDGGYVEKGPRGRGNEGDGGGTQFARTGGRGTAGDEGDGGGRWTGGDGGKTQFSPTGRGIR
ncbi:MAG: hypothetical protein GXY20_01235 [Clostridiales bacterium]|nr:hypothetical protein [Clostridiales bacterium]